MTAKELNAIAAKLAEQMQNVLRKTADEIPPGWFTIKQLAAFSGKDYSSIARQLKLVGAESKKFNVVQSRGVRPAAFYRLK